MKGTVCYHVHVESENLVNITKEAESQTERTNSVYQGKERRGGGKIGIRD